MSFWIKLESAPARVTCGILTFLAISSQTQSFNAELPKVSYIKAIDVWMFVCNLFVFLSLMEYAFAQVLLRREEKKIEYMRVRRSSMDSMMQTTPSLMQQKCNEQLTQRRFTADAKTIENGHVTHRNGSQRGITFKQETESILPDNIDEMIRQKEHILKGLSGLSIDHMSRKAFPIAFAVFNILYWAICCSVPKEDLPDDCIIQPIKLD